MSDSINLLRELINIPSSSGKEKEIAEFIVRRLKPNFKITLQKVKKDRFNILASIGKPNLLLTTHMDTVPVNIPIREDKNFIYGRGACDTKGIIAAMICAAEKAKQKGLNDFALLFDVGEETDFCGIKKAIELANPKIVIVGEPTDFKIVNGQKGLLGIELKCRGIEAHGSTPSKGKSAIKELIKILSKIQTLKLPNNKDLGQTTINIGKINGGTAANLIPSHAKAIIEFRTTTNNKDILQLLNKFQDKITTLYSFEPLITKINKELITLNDTQIITVPYFTEMYFWKNKNPNCNTFVFGPGNSDFAHARNEKIKKQDVIKAVTEYLKIIKLNNKTFKQETIMRKLR